MTSRKAVGFKSSARVRVSLDCIIHHPFHLHDDMLELLCLVDGSLIASDSAQDYHLSPGDIYIFNPNDPHSIRRMACDGDVLTIQIDQKHYLEHYGFKDFPYFICDPSIANRNHLTRQFKKWFMKTPAEYRRSIAPGAAQSVGWNIKKRTLQKLNLSSAAILMER